MTVQIDAIREAAKRIQPIAHRTPVLTSRSFDEQAGLHAFFKCENFQRGGAFKIRGASNFIYQLSKEQLSRGVVTYSSGNHAQALTGLQKLQLQEKLQQNDADETEGLAGPALSARHSARTLNCPSR